MLTYLQKHFSDKFIVGFSCIFIGYLTSGLFNGFSYTFTTTFLFNASVTFLVLLPCVAVYKFLNRNN